MKRILFFILISSVLSTTCTLKSSSQYTYEQPEHIHDGINTGSIEEVSINTKSIQKAINKIKKGKFNQVHSILIYKNNKLVLEEYFPGYKYQWNAPSYIGEPVHWNRDMMHPVMSCAKSFVSACIGIAIDQGYIQSVDESIFDYLPYHQEYRTNGKENITIEHLLTMTSGLAWNEWNAPHGTSANDIDRLYFECSNDPIKCVLERDLIAPPGEFFTYSGGGIVMLGEIIKNASGLNIDEFSKKYLFNPMGISSSLWFQYENGVYATDGSLSLTPRDMLKLGILYLNNGTLNGEKIISKQWVEKSSHIYGNNNDIKIPIEDSGKNGYGYTWWIKNLKFNGKNIKMYRANGWGGQTIMVFPELDMVIVTTCGNYAAKSKLFKLVNKYILPAIKA